MAVEEVTALKVKIEDNFDEVSKRLSDVSAELRNVHKEMMKAGKSKGFDSTSKELTNLKNQVKDVHRLHDKFIRDFQYGNVFGKNVKDLEFVEKKLSNLSSRQIDYENTLRKHQQETSADKKKALEEEIKLKEQAFKKELSQATKHVDHTFDAIESKHKDLVKVYKEDKDKIKKMWKDEIPKEVSSGLGKGVKAFVDRDVGGILSSIMGSATSVGTGLIAKLRNERQIRQAERERAGKAPSKMDTAFGAIGGKLGSLGKMLGPMMMAAGGAALLIKMLVDSEAQTKEWNKELTKSTNLLRLGAGNAQLGAERMKEMRDVAHDSRLNIALGIDPKAHTQVLAALEAHHAGINLLSKQYKSFGETQVEVMKLVRRSALNLGVEMTDVAEFLATMTTTYGKDIENIRTDLTHITEEARRSGMSTKAFFAAVSQISGELAFYNLRLEHTTTLLSEMNKFLDPKNAQKFVETLTKGAKQLSDKDAYKRVVMAEGSTKEAAAALRKNTERQMADMFGREGSSLGKQFSDLLAKQGISVESDDFSGMYEALSKMSRKQHLLFMKEMHRTGGRELTQQLTPIVRQIRLQQDETGVMEAATHMDESSVLDQHFQTIERMEGVSWDSSKDVISGILQGVSSEGVEILRRADEALGGTFIEFEKAKKEGTLDQFLGRLEAEQGIRAKVEGGKLVGADSGQAIETLGDLFRSMTEERRKEWNLEETRQKSAAERQISETQAVKDILQGMIYDVLNRIGFYTASASKFLSFLRRRSDPKEKALTEQHYKEEKLKHERAELRTRLRNTTSSTQRKDLEEQISSYDKKIARVQDTQKAIHVLSDKSKGTVGEEEPDKSKGTVGEEEPDKSKWQKAGDLARNLSPFGWLESKLDARRTSKKVQQKLESESQGIVAFGEAAGVENVIESEEGLSLFQQYSDMIRSQMSSEGLREGSESYEKEYIKRIEDQARLDKSSIKFAIEQRDILKEIEEGAQGQAVTFDQILAVLDKRGINIKDEQTRKWAKENAAALTKVMTDQALNKFLDDKDLKGLDRNDVVNSFMSGRPLEGLSGRDSYYMEALRGEARKVVSLPPMPANDAIMKTSGVAPLSFKKGDMIIDKDSIARTMRGSAGEFAPKFLREAMSGIASSRLASGLPEAGIVRGSGTSTFQQTNHFHINGETQDVRSEILRALEMYERKKYGES